MAVECRVSARISLSSLPQNSSKTLLLPMVVLFTSSHRVRLLPRPRYFPGTLLVEAMIRYAREFAVLVVAHLLSLAYMTSLRYLKVRPTWKSLKAPF